MEEADSFEDLGFESEKVCWFCGTTFESFNSIDLNLEAKDLLLKSKDNFCMKMISEALGVVWREDIEERIQFDRFCESCLQLLGLVRKSYVEFQKLDKLLLNLRTECKTTLLSSINRLGDKAQELDGDIREYILEQLHTPELNFSNNTLEVPDELGEREDSQLQIRYLLPEIVSTEEIADEEESSHDEPTTCSPYVAPYETHFLFQPESLAGEDPNSSGSGQNHHQFDDPEVDSSIVKHADNGVEGEYDDGADDCGASVSRSSVCSTEVSDNELPRLVGHAVEGNGDERVDAQHLNVLIVESNSDSADEYDPEGDNSDEDSDYSDEEDKTFTYKYRKTPKMENGVVTIFENARRAEQKILLVKYNSLIQFHEIKECYVAVPGISHEDIYCRQLGCRRVFKTKKEMELHVKARHDTSKRCKICGKTFKNYYKLKLHSVDAHLACTCDLCGKISTGRVNYRNHRQSHAELFICLLCGKEFSCEDDLMRHVQAQIICKQKGCEFRTESRNEMVIHRRVVHFQKSRTYTKRTPKEPSVAITGVSGKFQCSTCLKIFQTEDGLVRHSYHFCNAKMALTYPCTECGALYSNHRLFERHMKTHDDGGGGTTYTCPHCDRKCSNLSFLDRHLEVVHAIVNP